MDGCCGVSPESQEREAKRMKEEDEAMNMTVEVNGATLKVKDLFPDYWAAKDFVSKLRLLNASKGGKALMDTSPSGMLEEEVED